MIGHVTDAIATVDLLLPGDQDPDGLAGDPGDAVCRDQDDGRAEDDSPAEELQPGGDDDHLDQPGEGLGGSGQSGGVLLPTPHYAGAGGGEAGEPAGNDRMDWSWGLTGFEEWAHSSLLEMLRDDTHLKPH